MSALSPIATAKALAKGHVRYTPESGHVQRTHACPLRANSGHCEIYFREMDAGVR
jgi:hypothetical protein